MFNSLFVKTDVTAVQIWKHFIFASVGGFVNIYDLESNKLLIKREIFEGQKIYGFKANSNGTKFIIYGGKYIALIDNCSHKCKELKIIQSKILSDWILDTQWIDSDTKILTVHMQNKVIVWSENFVRKISVKSEERCILYSAHIYGYNYKDIIIFAGTVFSEVLLWKPFYVENGLSPVLKRLNKHKGVIFSIHCDIEKGLITSASDDRSAILWKVNTKELLQNLSPTNSDQLKVTSICQVYGHSSRIFRSVILLNSFVTAGEDSLLIIWSLEGKMLRKIDTHQGGPIWSLDYDSKKDIICTGGNDGGLSLYSMNSNVFTDTLSLPNADTPNAIGLLHNGDMVCLSENCMVYFYNKPSKYWEQVATHHDLKSYSILQTSPCKRMVALAGFIGQIYIYLNKNKTLKKVYTFNFQSQTRIYSFHWLTCKTFLVCQDEGKLHFCFLCKGKINVVQTFILPPSKERWSTCATIIKDHIIVGDRKGNVYNFKLGKQNLTSIIKKSHSHLGITKMYTNQNTVISLGRDGILKRYKLFDGYLETIDSNKTKFAWLVALESNYLLSFSGNNFVISDCKLHRVLYETYCGGGHRSWDYLNKSGTFTFCFLKHKVINRIELLLEEIVPREVISGYHVHEINCLKALNFNDNHILISGGEDTLLRISALKADANLEVLDSFKVHLSSIRSLVLYRMKDAKTGDTDMNYLIFSAGGRAQIICWHFCINTNNLGTLSVTCNEKYNFYEPLCQDQVETRIMDISILETNGVTTLFSGCSDGSIKIFLVSDSYELIYQKRIFYTCHSVLKIVNIFILDNPVLLAMYPNGNIVFWDVLKIFSCENASPFDSYKIHQSGINSYSYQILDNNNLLLLTGGDDNSVILTLFKFGRIENKMAMSKVSYFEDKKIHCAQITGTYLGDKYFVTSSIDQRICVWKWTIINENIQFHFVQKYITTIADPQGLDYVVKDGSLNLFIYGVGIEHLMVKIDDIV